MRSAQQKIIPLTYISWIDKKGKEEVYLTYTLRIDNKAVTGSSKLEHTLSLSYERRSLMYKVMDQMNCTIHIKKNKRNQIYKHCGKNEQGI